MQYTKKWIAFAHIIFNPVVLFSIFSVLFVPANAFAQEGKDSLNKAIDRAGLQRMLTQSMLKSYCQKGQDHFYAKPDEKLNKTIKRYEQGLQYLKDFESIKGVQASLQKINKIWPHYKKVITAPANKKSTPDLVTFNEKLLSLSHQIVLDLAAESGKELANIVNISGRQRMLSQRIELFYLLRDWGFQEEYYSKTLATARLNFTESLTYLNNYPENTEEISGYLEKARISFGLFEHSLNEKNNAFLVNLTVEQLLKQMNATTFLYSQM